MDQLDDKELDNLFGSLKDLEGDPDPALWSEIKASLPAKGFFQWGFKHFNIYYSGALFFGAAMLIVYALSQPNVTNVQVQEKKSDSTSVVLPKTNSNVLEEATPDKKVIRLKSDVQSEQNHLDTKNDTSLTISVPQADTDSEVLKPDTLPKKITPKKIVKIVRRDTLRVSDSIGIKRRRWQK